ncbi:hypothetical protein ABQE48_13115 [Mycolicibacterium thermoresistibile]
MPPTTDRKELLRRAILREAIINRDPITVEDSADARAVTDDLLRRKICEVKPATGARLVTMTAQPNEAQEDGMRVSRQALLWLEDEGDISESELTERLKTAFPVASIRRGIARMKLLSLIDVNGGRVIDRTGDGLRPESRDPATIGELVSLITGEAPILPEPETTEPETEPTRPQGEEADASEPTRPQGEEPETTEDEPDTAAAPAQPDAAPSRLVTRDDMPPDEIIAAFNARYLTPELSDTSMTYLAGIVKKVHEEGGYLLDGSELWGFMDQHMGGALWDFVRCLVARGVLHRTTDERGVPAFTVEERFLLPEAEPEQPAEAAPADTAFTDDAPAADEPVENLRLVLTDGMTPEETEARFREVYAYDEESSLRASENIHKIINAALATNGRLVVDSTEWRELDTELGGVLWDYIRALRADGMLKERTNALGRRLFEYTPPAPEPEPEDERTAARRERMARESLENLEQAQREADIAAGAVEPTPPPAPKKRGGLSDLIERRLDTLDHKVNRIGELVHKVYDIHQRTSVSVEAQLLRDADPFVVEVLKAMVVHLYTAPGNMLTPGALHRKLSATPKAGGPSPRDCYDLAFDLGVEGKVVEVVDGGRRVRLVDTSLLMSTAELTRRLSRSENYRKGKVTAWTTRKARALLDA